MTVRPDQPKPGGVLAAVKHAARRLTPVAWRPCLTLAARVAVSMLRPGEETGRSGRTRKHSIVLARLNQAYEHARRQHLLR